MMNLFEYPYNEWKGKVLTRMEVTKTECILQAKNGAYQVLTDIAALLTTDATTSSSSLMPICE